MGKVTTGFSMSLDGFVATKNDDVQRVFQWMFMGNTSVEASTGDHDLGVKVAEESASVFEEAIATNGALLAGRRIFDVAGAWGGKHPLNVPMVIMTHRTPQEWVKPDSPFTFMSGDIAAAVNKAKELAGDKNVAVASPNVLQQVIRAGLLDEIHIDLVPVLLGDGIRMFDHLGGQIELEIIRVTKAPNVTHLDYRVVR